MDSSRDTSRKDNCDAAAEAFPADEERLNLFLDGELDDTRESALFAHMAACATCRQKLNAVLEFRRLIRDEHIEVPSWTDDRLFRRLEKIRPVNSSPDRHRDRSFWTRKTTVTVRAAVLLLLLAASVSVVFDRRLHETPVGRVAGTQEFVDFGTRSARLTPVYVFYPGLVIEESR